MRSNTPIPSTPQAVRGLIIALIIVAFLCLACLPFCHAQAANAIAISSQVLQPTGQPAQSASVLICQITAIGTPCDSTGVTLYADPNLISVIGNPVTTDQYGNYSVFTTVGAYQIQVTPAGASGPTYIYYDINELGSGALYPPFRSIQSGTNTGAAMTVGSGASLTYAGSGTINASSIAGVAVTGTPSVGYVPTATGAATATWQTNNASTAITATNLAGGALGSIPYQAAPGSTAFLASPTSTGAYVPLWQPTGSAVAPTVVSGIAALNALGAANGTTPIVFGNPFSATITNNVVNASLQVGSDLGAKVASAVTLLSATSSGCGIILIPQGTYTWTTHDVVLPNCDRIIGYGSVINVSTGTQPPLVMGSQTPGFPGPTYYLPGGIDGVTFAGPISPGIPAGVATSFGPWIGGDTTGTLTLPNAALLFAQLPTFHDLHVRGFGCGFETGQVTQPSFYGIVSEFNAAGSCHYTSGGGTENVNFHGVQYLNNYFWGIYSPFTGSEMTFEGSSLDYNGQNVYEAFTGTTSTSTSITSVSSTAGLYVGMEINGSGVQYGSVITAISGSTLTISIPTTSSITGTSLTANGGQIIMESPTNLAIHGGHMENNETPYVVIASGGTSGIVEIQDVRFTMANDTAATVESVLQVGGTNTHLKIDGLTFSQAYQTIYNGILDWGGNGADSALSLDNFFATSEGNGVAQPVFKAGSTFAGYYKYPVFSANGDETGYTTNRTLNVGSVSVTGSITATSTVTAPGFISNGPTFTVTGCSVSSPVGGATAGTFTVGASGACAVTLTIGGGFTAPHSWSCWATDQSRYITLGAYSGSTTQVAMEMTSAVVAGDMINFGCMGF